MPIYEYSCSNCGHNLEVIQGIKDEPLVTCPECQNKTLVKMVSAAGFRLKGGGWYETDFKDSDKKKNLASTDEQAAKSEGKSEGKSEVKKDGGKSEGTETKTSTTQESNSAKTENKVGKTENNVGKKDQAKSQTTSKPNPSKGGTNQKE